MCRYRISKTDQDFIVDLDVSLCMEGMKGCQLKKTIFHNTVMPIPVCNLDAEFAIPGEETV